MSCLSIHIDYKNHPNTIFLSSPLLLRICADKSFVLVQLSFYTLLSCNIEIDNILHFSLPLLWWNRLKVYWNLMNRKSKKFNKADESIFYEYLKRLYGSISIVWICCKVEILVKVSFKKEHLGWTFRMEI